MLESGMTKYEIRPFGGENIWDLIKRVGSFLEDIQKELDALKKVRGKLGSTIKKKEKKKPRVDFSFRG